MSTPLSLCYHAVSDRWSAALSISAAALERQLRHLLRRGYRFHSFSELVLGRSRLSEKDVAVTFDDAFLSVFEQAFPILTELAVPATLFVPVGFPEPRRALAWEGTRHWLDSEYAEELRPMSWAHIGRLAEAGWEIGSHTVSHPHLTRLDPSALREELARSRSQIEQRLGQACLSIAYPYGDVDRRVLEVAAAVGYTTGAALPTRFLADQPLCYPRVGIYRDDSSLAFRLKTSPAVRRLRATRLAQPTYALRRTIRALCRSR